MNDHNIEISTTFKKHYPFRLACPSFIYPAGYADNVRRLGACVDEIELLLLESAPECLPLKNEIHELAALKNDSEITFNIHLPTDIHFEDGKPASGNTAVDALLQAIDLARPLEPVSWTLHVPFNGEPDNEDGIIAWQERVRHNLKRLLSVSGLPARIVAIENLDYPLEYLDAVIRELDFSICLDTGHLMVQGKDCVDFYRTWQERIIIIHTHGVQSGRDHLPLDRLSRVQTEQITHILQAFEQSLSLEVFSLPALTASLDYLDRICRNLPQSQHE